MFIIEGNIGAGKSTLLRLIDKQIPELNAVLEPVDQWQKQLYGQSLLYNFYEQPRRWAYTFELLTLISRVREMLKEQKESNEVNVIERSIYSGYYCFAKNSYMQGFLTDIEWHIYQEWFKFLVSDNLAHPHGFIYLRVSPEVAYTRVKKRNRYAEKTMSLRYLKQIHDRHEAFLSEKSDILPALQKIPVLTLDCDKEFESDKVKQIEFLDLIRTFCAVNQKQINKPSPKTTYKKEKVSRNSI